MIAVVQRVLGARGDVGPVAVGVIGRGLAVLVAVEAGDGQAEAERMADRLLGLRIFPQGEKAYDLTVGQVGGELLVVSNFTVAADASTGRRPSLSPAAKPLEAQPIFEHLLRVLRADSAGVRVESGRFGAEMRVGIENDGPCTFLVKVPAAVGGAQ